MNDFNHLESYLQQMILNLSPGERKKMMRAVTRVVQRKQQQRITKQRAPDGTKYAPRKQTKTIKLRKPIRFIYNKGIPGHAETRQLSNWYGGPKMIIGYDTERKSIRSFLKSRVTRYLKSSTGGSGQPKTKETNKMFLKLKTRRFMNAVSTSDEASIGFNSDVQQMANVHQYGLKDKVNKRGHEVRFDERPLLGLTKEENRLIEEIVIQYVSRQ